VAERAGGREGRHAGLPLRDRWAAERAADTLVCPYRVSGRRGAPACALPIISHPYFFWAFSILAHESRRATVRLKTSFSGDESTESTMK